MSQSKIPVRKLALAAMLLAMNTIMSSSVLSVPVPGGHMYLNDLVIVTASILLEPPLAMFVGGVGAFLGDLLFYPTPMFVSLVTHGLQAMLIALFVHRIMKEKPIPASILGAVVGLVVTVAGYTLGRAYIYSTPAYAIAKFPFQILQTVVGSTLALILCWPLGLVKIYQRQFGKI